MKHTNLRANERVFGTLSSFASSRDLKGLGGLVVGVIGAELGKAGLASEDQIEEVFQSSLYQMFLRCSTNPKPIENFRTYFRVVGQNEARRYMDPVIRAERWAKEWLPVLEGEVQLPEEPLQDERRAVLAALPRLRPRVRQIIEGVMVHRKSDQEMAAALGLSNGAFRTAKHRALTALREALAELAEASGPAEGNKTLRRASSQ